MALQCYDSDVKGPRKITPTLIFNFDQKKGGGLSVVAKTKF